MNDHSLPSAADERYGVFALIRRLLTEQGLVHWRKYIIAFVFMAVAAGCTAFSAYLIGDVINQAYVNRSLRGIVTLGAITVVLFSIKGLATYAHSVMLRVLAIVSSLTINVRFLPNCFTKALVFSRIGILPNSSLAFRPGPRPRRKSSTC